MASLAAVADPPAKQGSFRIRADVLFALERGPVVVRVVLSYQGRDRIQINQIFTEANSFIKSPPLWSMREPELTVETGTPSGPRTMNCGDEWTEIHYLHHTYKDIPSGRVKLQIEWPICSAGEPGERARVGKRLRIHP